MAGTYHVSVVAHDLYEHEAVGQLLHSLDTLEHTVTNVFQRILHRVGEEKQRLNAVGSRVSSAQAKVAKISGTNKALTVFSAPRYPAPALLSDYNLLYSSNHHHRKPFTMEKRKLFAVNLGRPPEGTGQDVLDQAAYVSSLNSSTLEVSSTERMKEGLGLLPEFLPSVSSVILFNTQDNPYKKYRSLDNLAGVDREGKKDAAKDLAKAPKTMLDGDVLPQFEPLKYGYKPKMKDLPTFNLPSTLPDLPGIADISWSASIESSTFPSAFPMSSVLPSIAPSSVQLPSLPSLPDPSFKVSPPPSAPTASTMPTAPPPGPPVPTNGPPLPTFQQSMPMPPPPSSVPAPPPPPPMLPSPPPPPLLPANQMPPPPVPVPAPAAALPSVADDRKGLLASLRNPNNKDRLRKAADEVMQGNKQKKEKSVVAAKGHMDILREHLSMRNKAFGSEADKKPSTQPTPPPKAPEKKLERKPSIFDKAQIPGLQTYLQAKSGKADADQADDWDD